MNGRQKPIALPGRWLLLFAAGWLPATTVVGGTLIYHDFSSPGGLILRAYAVPFDGRLRLTTAKSGLGIGGAWLETKQPVKDGFETTFQFQITDKKDRGADGMAFVIQNGPTPGLAGRLQSRLRRLTDLLVLKFKNYHGHDPVNLTYDEVAVMVADFPTTVLWDCGILSFASVTNDVEFSDGQITWPELFTFPATSGCFSMTWKTRS